MLDEMKRFGRVDLAGSDCRQRAEETKTCGENAAGVHNVKSEGSAFTEREPVSNSERFELSTISTVNGAFAWCGR